MKKVKNTLGILFSTLFLQIFLSSTAYAAADINTTNTDVNSSDINTSIIDNNSSDMNLSDINISLVIDIPKGRSVISGDINVSKLNNDIYAVWIVDGGDWYGYSPDKIVQAEISASYKVIEGIIPAYKAVIVWALNDTNITLEANQSVEAEQNYGTGFTIHGTNNQDLSVDDVTCANEKGLSAIFKVYADEPSVYVAEREIEEIENFSYIYQNEGYYVLCETVLGGNNE